jgi:hypothetical protein
MCPFSINGIERRAAVRERYTAQVWTIAINWPRGELTFEASAFEQRAIGDAVLCDEQRLPAELRKNIKI